VKILRILVVEDDRLVADALKSTLSHYNYAVEIADDGRTGLDLIEAFDYDLLLLDVMLPKLDGISICRHVRSQGYMMPILLLTAQDRNHDRAVGLDAGADDYVIKPFDPEELTARIRALLRRATDRAQPILSWEKLTLDPRNFEVTYQGNSIALTPKEYALIELFLRHNRRVFSCGAILEHLWTYEDAPSEEAVRTHIKGLRYKLRVAGAPADLIETVYGIGYRLKRLIDTKVEPKQIAPMPPTTSLADVPQRLAEIWDRHRDRMFERVATIERVITALLSHSLTTEIRIQASNSAHSLAGALGTFGLPIGSQVAKQIESILSSETLITLAHRPQLESGVSELRRQIGSKVESILPGEAIATEPSPLAEPLPWRITKIATIDVTIRSILMISQDLEAIAKLQAAAPPNLNISVGDHLPWSSKSTRQNIRSIAKPDLIILDLDYFANQIEGLSVLTELNRQEPNIPIVILSQMGSLDLRIEVACRGGRLFLAKPIETLAILQTVDRILPQVNVTPAKVTIVDDDRALLEALTVLLSPLGIAVTTLAEPRQFWETLEASVPDLLILDLDLPTHDGVELCRAVRTDERWATLPIMFLTAHTAPMAIDRVFAAGADDFVSKPIVGSVFATRIINRLKRISISPGKVA
jgi:DNA-binding response OmpR family regulator/HPt (histidine-containing phosphotransfer) domain-containing protein